MRRKSNRTNIPKDDYYVYSDLSGFRILASEAVFGAGTQEGLIMHKDEYRPLQPQLYLMPQYDNITPDVTRSGDNKTLLDSDIDTFTGGES